MAASINASTSAGVVTTADTSGNLNLQSNGTTKVALTSTGAAITGTNTNDSAAAGNVGEYIESVSSGNTAVNGTTNQYKSLTSISLTAGDWDVSALAEYVHNGGSSLTYFGIGIGTADGNSGTGLVTGQNFRTYQNSVTSTTIVPSISIPPYRVSLAGTTTYYLKVFCGYTVATPNVSGYRISARRVR